MSKQDSIEIEGTVSDVLPNATFRVLVPRRHNVLTTLAGNMRRNRARARAFRVLCACFARALRYPRGSTTNHP